MMGIDKYTIYYIRRAVRYEEDEQPLLQWVALADHHMAMS